MSIFIIILIIISMFVPMIQVAIKNLHSTIFYFFKDLFYYFKEKKWRIWKGKGINMYCGYFGRGKTLSAVKHVTTVAKRYKLNVYSNIKLGIDYIPLVNYQQIIDAPPNSIFLVDEFSTVFHARSWSDFPSDLIFTILQSRHCKKQLIGTSPRFMQVDKIIRDSTDKVIMCNKMWRFQNLSVYDGADLENSPQSSLVKPLYSHAWFVRDKNYHMYDTFELIDNVKRYDFLSNDEILKARGDQETGLIYAKKISRKGKKRM